METEDIYSRLARLEKAIVVNIVLTAILAGEQAYKIFLTLLS